MIRIVSEHLLRSRTENLERLAFWLGCAPERYSWEDDAEYHARIVRMIEWAERKIGIAEAVSKRLEEQAAAS